jgi:hypothetical protein
MYWNFQVLKVQVQVMAKVDKKACPIETKGKDSGKTKLWKIDQLGLLEKMKRKKRNYGIVSQLHIESVKSFARKKWRA